MGSIPTTPAKLKNIAKAMFFILPKSFFRYNILIRINKNKNKNMSQENLAKILENLLTIRKQIDETISLIELEPNNKSEIISKINSFDTKEYFEEDSKIIEGIFNGEIMIGPDGKQYSIPANYISKSKIVEGDKMKLTIKKDGTFVYKQIEQSPRIRLIGTLIKDETNKGFAVLADGKVFKVQKASVTYYKGEIGDEVIAIVPENKKSIWAAIENITKPNNIAIKDNEEIYNETEEIKAEKVEIKKEPQKLNISSISEITPISLDDIK